MSDDPSRHICAGTLEQVRERANELLEGGPSHRFGDWPNRSLPRYAAGVYTVWDGPRLIYVGMAGRGHSAESVAQRQADGRPCGLLTRLNSHASGRRSGDQFCVYVADRVVLPTLTPADIAAIGEGTVLLDDLVRDHIRQHYSYRFVVVDDCRVAHGLEVEVKAGALRAGRPLLNPA